MLITSLCLLGFVSAESTELVEPTDGYEPIEVALNLKANTPAKIKIVEVLEDKTEMDIDEIEVTGSYVYKFKFSEPEIHIYRVFQVPGDNKKMKYDDAEYYVHLEVSHNEDTEALEGDIVAFESENSMDKVPVLEWENDQPDEVPTGDTTMIDIYQTVGVAAGVLVITLLVFLFKDRKKEN